MLLNQKGGVVHVPHISHKAPNREAILAPLREVKEPESLKCQGMFRLQQRARFVQCARSN